MSPDGLDNYSIMWWMMMGVSTAVRPLVPRVAARRRQDAALFDMPRGCAVGFDHQIVWYSGAVSRVERAGGGNRVFLSS
jgi:hypothetical protein